MVSQIDAYFGNTPTTSPVAPTRWGWSEGPCTTPLEESTVLAIRAWSTFGDQRAAQWLVGAYRPLIRSIVNRLPASASIDDAEQETLIRAFNALHRYDVSQPFATWISKIARNVLLNTLRNEHRHEIHFDRDAMDQIETRPGGRRPDESLASREQLESIMMCLNRLAPDSSRIFRRHVFEGLSPDELSEAEGVSAGAVRISVHRTRTHLRNQCEYSA